jgi:predicted Zn finger-like uncharacterized protein
MQIQCPHCKSRYRLGAEMTDAYGGFVRCGNCNYKFNIHDQVSVDDEYSALVNTIQRPSQRSISGESGQAASKEARPQRIEPKLESQEEEEPNIRFGEDEFEDDFDSNVAVDEQRKEPQFGDIPNTSGAIDSSDSSGTGINLQKPHLPEAERAEEMSNDLNQHDSQHSNGIDELDEINQNAPLSDIEAVVELTEVDDELDFDLDEEPDSEIELTESLKFDVTPESSTDEYPSGPSLINDEANEDSHEPDFFSVLFTMLWRGVQLIFWILLIFALAYLLFTQVRDTLYPAYRNHPIVQRINTGFCKYLPCDDAKYNVELFEIVVSRMDEVNDPGRQFHISLFLLNKAQSAQPYPNILLSLKTIDGSISGQRAISPEEYFTSHDSLISSNITDQGSAQSLIKPNKLGKILIKLDNPPQDAVGFEAHVIK